MSHLWSISFVRSIRGGILISILLTSLHPSSAQNKVLDSLYSILQKVSQEDTSRITITLRIAHKIFHSDQKETIKILDDLEDILDKGSILQKADAAHYRGAAYQYLQQYDSLAYYQELSLHYAQQADDPQKEARAFANLATVYRKKGELDEAVNYYEKALQVFQNLEEAMPIASISNGLGLVHHARGDYQSALKAYHTALRIFQDEGHQKYEGIMLNNIGRVHNEQKNYDEALKYYRQYLEISRSLQDSAQMATSYNNIGSLYSDMNKLDSASLYLKKCIRIQEAIYDISGLGVAYNNLGKVYNLRQQHHTGMEYNKKALTLATEVDDKKTQAFAALELSKSYDHLGNRNEAVKHASQGIQLADEMGDMSLIQRINEQLYQLNRGINTELALRYLEKAYALKDTLLNRENIEALTAMELTYEFDKKHLVDQQRIATLELKEQYRKNQVRNQYFTIASLGIGIIGLGWLLLKLATKNNRIREQNVLINKALEEKNVLLKEIHHRVKNNLQVISSLLGIQSRKVKDSAALDALNEGRSRVQSMSLIHQDLYQHDNLKCIAIRDYFDRLVNSLFLTYNIHSDRIKVHSEIDNMLLDIDTVIPLGLVINELISNALKYAFPNGQGNIRVQLKEENDTLHLLVEDDGTGMDHPESILENDSFGYDLITSLVDKLEGTLNIKVKDGTKVHIEIHEYQIAA